MICPKCNTKNPEDSKFCKECAAPLTSAENVVVTKTIQSPIAPLGKKVAGKYEIIEEIGRGGMGIVYKAKDTKLKRNVALKFLPAELMQDKKAKARFIQEAQAAAALDHPNICTVHEVDDSDGQTFIAMSYIEGQSLKDKLEDGLLEVDEAKDIVLLVAEGLKEAHEKGIIHRDIKPANILLTKKGQAKITDFGLAKLSWGVDLTKTSTIMGTVAYMSPEQARAEEVDHRTDIWSLGAMLYEMLTGERPFSKDHEQALIFSILNDEQKPISSFRSDIPSNMEHVIQKALEKDAAKRQQSVQEFIYTLKEKPQISTSKSEKSIAVLPFTNMSADPDQEYFCDGMTEEIINALTHIADLKVIARTSSFMFKGKHDDMREIGKKLDVEHLLEGSVRKAGNRLRITAQLIKVSDGSHLWSEKYDRHMEDIFDIQDEISLAIVENLKLKLLKKEKAAILKQPTEDKEAYNLYLKGRYFMSKLTDEGCNRAIEMFEKAIRRDAKFALAYAAMSESYVYLCWGWGICPPKDTMTKAKKAAEKAVEIDPDLAEAQNALAIIKGWYDWDRFGAEGCFKKAIELNPNSPSIRMWHGLFLTYFEHKLSEAIQELQYAQKLDPLDLQIKNHIAIGYVWLQDLEKAHIELQSILTLDSHNALDHHLFSDVYSIQEQYEKAISYMIKAIELGGDAISHTAELAELYAHTGKTDETWKIVRELEERAHNTSAASFFIAVIYIALGDIDKAFEWLNKGAAERDLGLIWGSLWFTKLSGFKEIAEDARWSQILDKMGLSHLAPKMPPPKQEKSIVVLPFDDVSPDKDNEYFSDGLTEEIISDLSKIQALRVISRTSTMMLKGSCKSIKAIALELNVQYVLEGSVRKAGNNLRITAQLIDASNDAHVWSEKYAGTLDDVFDMQERVSKSIVDALKLELSTEEKQKMIERPFDNVKAYEFYLRAKHEINTFAEEGIENAIQHLESGLKLIGESAILYAGLGYAFWQYFNVVMKAEYLNKGLEYAQKALELDPNSSEAHFVTGNLHFFHGTPRDLKKIVFHLEKALAIDPFNCEALFHLNLVYIFLGKTSLAASLVERHISIDPLSFYSHWSGFFLHWAEGNLRQALEYVSKVYQLAPGVQPVGLCYAMGLALNDRIEETSPIIDQTKKIDPGSVFAQIGDFCKNAWQGKKKEALESITPQILEWGRMDFMNPWFIVQGYSLIGEKEEALNWLEEWIGLGCINYPLMNKNDPFLENIRGEERFKKLMVKVKKEWESFVS